MGVAGSNPARPTNKDKTMMDVFNKRKEYIINTMYSGLDQMADKPILYNKIQDVSMPVVGSVYYVPCIVRNAHFKDYYAEIDDQEIWMDLDHRVPPMKQTHSVIEYVPVLDHPHNDIENGQREVHYHMDDRFTGMARQSYIPHTYIEGFNFRDQKKKTNSTIRPEIKDGYRFEHLPLVCTRREVRSTTPVKLIKESKLAHKCIHKGKCPHRGYDLSNTPATDGVITCPLHGLKFDAFTKQLIELETK
jgi:hypothetical protein